MSVTRVAGVARSWASAAARVAAETLADAVALGAPSACAGCATPGPAVCASCAGAFQGVPRLHRPSPVPAEWLPVHVVAAYDGVVREVIASWKERGRRDVSAHLALPLAHAIRAAVTALPESQPGAVTIVPIPSSAAARRRRGEDAWERVVRQALDILARGVVAAGPVLRLEQCLHLARQTRDQAGLTAKERTRNLDGALTCSRPPRGPVVVVDDIVTTGATLSEAARALRAAGVGTPRGAAIAATSRSRT